ncbi:MAG: tetratricopeptide repeat protein [Kiritimatiellaeota bacterium]|nr:tetratricopeptide repeat protein [Kiritimatiellota bacterium]
MKKLLIVLGGLLFLGVVLFPLASTFIIRQGFAHPEKPWAAKAVFTGAHLKMLFQKPTAARQVFEAGLERFPYYPGAARVTYRIALCYEREGNTAMALQWYTLFLKQWPGHPWGDQARRRKAALEALEE